MGLFSSCLSQKEILFRTTAAGKCEGTFANRLEFVWRLVVPRKLHQRDTMEHCAKSRILPLPENFGLLHLNCPTLRPSSLRLNVSVLQVFNYEQRSFLALERDINRS